MLNHHSTHRLRVAALFALVLLLGPLRELRAQSGQTSTLIGKVTDATGGALPGAAVTITSPSLIGGPRSTFSDAEGAYRFPAILPGVYTVSAALDGFKTLTQTDLEVPVGITVTVDLTLEIATRAQSVVVIAQTSPVDVKASAAPAQLDRELLENLPVPHAQPLMMNLVPGVSGLVAFGGAQGSYAQLMDGVDVSDPYGGGVWPFFNWNWIEQVQVVGLGANAEYGEFTSVAANSIVRSGSNRFSGLFEYWTTRPRWVDANTSSLPASLRATFTPREIVSLWDTTAQIGGPILTDRLWFFAGFE